MEQTIIDIANGGKDTAVMLEEAATEAGFDIGAPDYLQGMLLRLYYAIALEDKMNECEDALSEDTDIDTVDAVLGASAAVDSAKTKMFDLIEAYSDDDREFAAEIDEVTLGDKAEDLGDLLNKLYKCEGIIRMAHRCSSRCSIYGMRSTDMPSALAPVFGSEPLSPEEAHIPQPPEDFISQKLGVDIEGLYMIREKLTELIGAALQGDDA